MNSGKRPRQGSDVPISELALIVLKPITFTAFSNPGSFLCLLILLLLFGYVSCHGTRGFNLLGAKTPGTCKLLLNSMLPTTPCTPVASISVIQSIRCLLSAIPLQHLLPPPNAPHQPPLNGVAVKWSDCMRLLASQQVNGDARNRTEPFEGREYNPDFIMLMPPPIDESPPSLFI